MSKMSQIHAEMTEHVNELGYETVEEAIADGWDSAEFYASYEKQNMVPTPYKPKDEQTKAHEAWLKEKEIVLGILRIDADTIDKLNDTNDLAITRTWVKSLGSDIKKAIKLIEEGEM